MELTDLEGIIYTRKSTVSDGRSTRDQEREGRNWCQGKQVRVGRVFCDEGISASRYGTKARTAWEDLKAYLKPGHILVAWEASRTTRDLEEYVALRNLCANLRVPLAYSGRVLDLTSGEDRFIGGLDALISERESEMISERVLRGIRSAAADGRPHARPPWGYRAIRPGEWELDPVEAPRVREAVMRLIGGESQYSVLRWLKATGNAPASISSLRRVLCSPTIAGKRVHKGQPTGKATWPAIITEAQHNQIVARTKRSYNLPGPEPKFLLSGIAICGKPGCGEKLRHRSYRDRKPQYICQHGHVARLMDMLDKEVEKAVFQRLRNINPADYGTEDPRVADANKQIEEIEEELEGWIEAAGQGEVTRAAFAKIEKTMRQRIAALRPRTVSDDKKLRMENWDKASIRERREWIRRHLRVEVPPLGKRRARPEDVNITPI